MSSSGNAEGDASTESTPKVVKFIVKMPQQQGKKELELPLSTTVLGAKEKIAELGDTPVERQRLIYSGRVMKNEETLEFYKVTDGTTIHMVKAAAPPASKSSTSASGSARPAVPTNISAGTANTPLAGLTGARYAGHVNLPSADIFGPDGGMGPPPGPEEMANIMSRPETQAAMNEFLNNPQLMDSLINSNPMFSGMSQQARQMLRDPNFRQMLTNPDMLRQMSALTGAMRGGGGASAFPAPGATDTTPSGAQASQTGSQAAANLFGGLGGGNNPFEALLGGAAEPPMFLPGYEGAGGAGAGQYPSDEEILAQIRLARQMGLLPGGPGGAGGAGAAPAQPTDPRELEERFAEQLRQLNDMGFNDLQLNLQALLLSNGDVQAAIEILFSS